MPTYDYQCAGCGHRFEHFQSMTSKVLRKCPSCGKLRLERLIGQGAGFIFKGSGFYITDYRGDSYRTAAEADANKAEGTKESTPDGSTTPAKDLGTPAPTATGEAANKPPAKASKAKTKD